ncbi:cell division protein SepF [Synechococcus sp. LTW-R]|uniref:cell division protein SepF n=1 Tax=Synechococcus sp. LTW-R TaxID=2751170 RepID=UPI001626E3F6|nr:cell division protein SepF [Synechococcus sp. LTW-R]MDM7960012.1 cell division protein SepF [Synechococcus sp. WH 8007]QNG30638.1 cell division protein SepF [Synechococcus sp. LTW-R]
MDPFLPRSEQDTPGWGPEVIVIHPPSFDAVQEAITALQDQATVVVNLSALPENQLQRAVDFLSGAAVALDAQQVRLGERVFLYAPHYVQLNRA